MLEPKKFLPTIELVFFVVQTVVLLWQRAMKIGIRGLCIHGFGFSWISF